MSNPPPAGTFSPPLDWEAVYATEPDAYFFGQQASQIARSALAYFKVMGGEPHRARALDLGCGEGRDTVFLADAGFHVTARDIAPTGLAKLDALRARQNVPPERIEPALQDVRDFPYPPQVYDLALAANVYQFVTPEEAPVHIKRLQSTVKPNGICAVSVFSPAMVEWGAQVQGRYLATAEELMAFFGDGWQVLDRTDCWVYRPPQNAMGSFVYVVARKGETA